MNVEEKNDLIFFAWGGLRENNQSLTDRCLDALQETLGVLRTQRAMHLGTGAKGQCVCMCVQREREKERA